MEGPRRGHLPTQDLLPEERRSVTTLLSRQNLQMAHEEKRSEALTQPQGIGQHGRERAGVGAPAQSGRRHSEPTLAEVCSWPIIALSSVSFSASMLLDLDDWFRSPRSAIQPALADPELTFKAGNHCPEADVRACEDADRWIHRPRPW